MTFTYFAYRLPHQNTIHYLKGRLTERSSIADLMGRGVVICDFHSEHLYQLEEVEEIDATEWQMHYKKIEYGSTSRVDYHRSFERVMAEIGSGRFEKIVLSKVKLVSMKQPPMNIFAQLNKNYLNTFNYFLSSPELGSWMGASPELLCEIEERRVKAVSLAGTKQTNDVWTDKEIEEQLYVTRYIKTILQDLHCSNIQIDGPRNIQAGPVQHLKTIISADLLSRESWRKLIDDLHPTPATCGTPAKKSKSIIREVETNERSLYTGFIGIFSDKNKACYVNLRCMEVYKDTALLYVGGGITALSNEEKEWDETERKAATLEQFLN